MSLRAEQIVLLHVMANKIFSGTLQISLLLMLAGMHAPKPPRVAKGYFLCNSPYRISAKFVPECITSSASGIFCSHANFQSRSRNLSFPHARFNSTLCSDCLQFNSLVHSSWMIAKVSEHHGDYWRRIHKILSVDLKNYGAISETR